jgi:Transcriptional regulator, AbiEi antitoxin
MHVDVVVGKIAAGQLGLITRSQAIEAGVSDNQIKKRARAGKWTRVRSGVFVIAGAPQTWEQGVLAAVLTAGRVPWPRTSAQLPFIAFRMRCERTGSR